MNMREDIFNFLREHQNEFVSGQQISEQLGVSRTAVWKHIRALKQKGYVIESYTKKAIACAKHRNSCLRKSWKKV